MSYSAPREYDVPPDRFPATLVLSLLLTPWRQPQLRMNEEGRDGKNKNGK
jgi:hypothetical protein